MTAIDLFAGGGGLTVGLRRSGFRVVLAIELDGPAVNTYRANHPDVHVERMDVREISGDWLRDVLAARG